MNRYTLSSDSPRWWWSSALAGGLTLTSVTAIAVLAATSSAAGQSDFRDDPPDQRVTHVVPEGDRPCFVRPLSWSLALDGSVPLCTPPGDLQPAFGFRAGSALDTSREVSPAHIQQVRWADTVL